MITPIVWMSKTIQKKTVNQYFEKKIKKEK